jgi:subtilisin family serine protease
MKHHLFISIFSVLLISFPLFVQAQNYVEGEVIVKYKDTTVLAPSDESIAPMTLALTPLSTNMLPPCELSTNEPLMDEPLTDEQSMNEQSTDEQSTDELQPTVQPTCLPFAPEERTTAITNELPTAMEPFTIVETFSVADETLALLEGKQGETTAELIAELSQDANVEYVEPNYLYTTFATFTPNDPDYAKLRGLDNIHRSETMQVFSGKTATTGSVVAVIDLGVDYRHPDLAQQMRNGSACKRDSGASR